MASHFRWSPNSPEVVPFNANFTFPESANHCTKTTPRIGPKGGNIYYPGNTMRFEIPAQGYVNFQNTTIEMDVSLLVPGVYEANDDTSYNLTVRFQNNIQSIFQRVRVMYGANPFEDIQDYALIVRCLTEWTAGNPSLCVDQGTITDGIGNTTIDFDKDAYLQHLSTRVKHIQGFSQNGKAHSTVAPMYISNGCGLTGIQGQLIPGYNPPAGASVADNGTTTTSVAWTIVTRRYQVQLMTGITTQGKLMPAQYMASSLAFEITLASSASCIMVSGNESRFASYLSALQSNNGYCVGNISLIPEVLHFDPSYDAAFLEGLQGPGVPIKISSWHTFQTSSSTSNSVSMTIQENSRSVKGIFVVQRRAQPSLWRDSGACFFDTAYDGLSAMKGYQFRIGTKYHPAAPVELSYTGVSNQVSNGGAEAYTELMKFLNILGVN